MVEVPVENPSAEATFDKLLTLTNKEADRIFSAEEGKGKFVDLHHIYLTFLNVKKLRK